MPSGQSVSTWNPSGAVWFKIWQESAIVTSGSISWPSNSAFPSGLCDYPNSRLSDAGSVTFPIPRCIENGDYLVRFEHIALHSASNAGGAQL